MNHICRSAGTNFLKTTHTNFKQMERKAFKEKAKQQLNEISKEIDSLKLKMKTASESLKLNYQKAVADFEAKKGVLETKYEEFTEIADDKWDEAKASFSKLSNKLKEEIAELNMERVVFEAKAKQQINDISNEIDSLKLKMKTASENLKHKFQEKIDDFEAKGMSYKLNTRNWLISLMMNGMMQKSLLKRALPD